MIHITEKCVLLHFSVSLRAAVFNEEFILKNIFLRVYTIDTDRMLPKLHKQDSNLKSGEITKSLKD